MSLSLLSMMTGGGPLPIPRIPCAPCLADLERTTVAAPGMALVDEPEQAATLVGGTLVCAAHARELLAGQDRGHIAAAIRDGLEQLGQQLDAVTHALERLEARRG